MSNKSVWFLGGHFDLVQKEECSKRGIQRMADSDY